MERAGLTSIETSSSAVKAPKRMVMPSASTPIAPARAGRRIGFDGNAGKIGHGSAAMKSARVGDGAEHAALHLDHLDGRVVVAAVGGAAAILEQQAFEAAVVGLAHGGVDADVGGDAGQHDVVGCRAIRSISSRSVAQNEPLPGLSMIGSPGSGRQFGDDLPARLAAHQDAAAGAGVADAGADALRAPALVGRQVGEIGPVALAGVDDVDSPWPASPRAPRGSARSGRGSARCRSPSCRHSRPTPQKSVCMSMMMSAVLSGRRSPFQGQG